MQTQHVTIEELRKAHHTVAQLALVDKVYLPIFKWIKTEMAAKELEDDWMCEVKVVANG